MIDHMVKHPPEITEKFTLLRNMKVGRRVAEEEIDFLASYFVETDSWHQIFNGDVDVIYGSKGTGKSALYSLLINRKNDLFTKNILLVSAEKPRGTPAFSDLKLDPPVTENEFVSLWKLYFASLLHSLFIEYGIEGPLVDSLESALAAEGLIKGETSLQSLLQNVWRYVRRILRPTEIECGIKVDPITSQVNGFTGKIVFSESSDSTSNNGVRSVNKLLEFANRALVENGMFNVWILLDRLDVAFADSVELEANALRALFRVYLDMREYENISLKIFLRIDIWQRITNVGFREASHITRHITIDWTRNSLLNLVVRRLLSNQSILNKYAVDRDIILHSLTTQEKFFYQLFPQQVEIGSNKPDTLEWILGRTKDGFGKTAPREVIHFLDCLRLTEVNKLEIGEGDTENQYLFSRHSFKHALIEVSNVRLTQTIYAEYPNQRGVIEALRGSKTLQNLESLSILWKVKNEQAKVMANELVDLGVFEKRGTRENPQFWVPFLYRDGLEMVQGAAD